MARVLELPAAFEKALEARFSGQERRLAALVRELSDGYVGKTAVRTMNAERAEAYLAYYGPLNALKTAEIFRELRLRYPERFAGKKARILDAGAGPGSATAGMCLALPDWQIEAVWLDADEAWDGHSLADRGFPAETVPVKRVCGEIGQLPLAPAHGVVLAANVINELAGDAAEKVRALDRLLRSALTRDGIAVLLEPALREPTRALHSIRERMIAAGWQVLAPCTGQGSCPMLRNDRDWCHETRDWRQPEYHRRIDQMAGLKKDALRYSFLVLGREKLPEGRAARVVSEIRREKGRTRFVTCDGKGAAAGWDALDRVMRTTPEFGELIRTLERGDLVSLPAGAGGRLSPGSGFGKLFTA